MYNLTHLSKGQTQVLRYDSPKTQMKSLQFHFCFKMYASPASVAQ